MRRIVRSTGDAFCGRKPHKKQPALAMEGSAADRLEGGAADRLEGGPESKQARAMDGRACVKWRG